MKVVGGVRHYIASSDYGHIQYSSLNACSSMNIVNVYVKLGLYSGIELRFELVPKCSPPVSLYQNEIVEIYMLSDL